MPIISNLPSLTVGTGTAYVPVVDTTGGTEVTKKASFDVIADYVIGTFGSINQASTTEYGLIKVGTTLQINTVTGVLNVADSPTWVSQRLSGSIAATSPTTGTLVVSGGVGVGGAIAVAGGIKITDGTNSLTTSTGAITVEGGVGVAKDLTIGGTLRFSNAVGSVAGDQIKILSSVNSSGTQTGALVVQGGAGVAGDVYVGGDLFVNGFEVSTSTYLLPTASPSILGGIKIGAGLLIDGNGVVTANAATNPTPARYLQINSSETENYVSAGEFAGIPGTTNTSGILINRGSIGGDINGANAAGMLYSDAFYWNNGFTSTRGTFVLLSALGGSSLTFSGIRVFPGVPEFSIFGSDNTGTVMSVRGHDNYHTLVTDDSHIPNKRYVDLKITTATTVVQGTVIVGDNLTITSGVLSVSTATNSVAGVVKAGTGLTAANDGTLTVNTATTATLGLVRIGSGLVISNGLLSLGTVPANLTVKGQSIPINNTTTSINFVGGGVTVQQSGLDVIVTIGSGGFNGGIVANTTTFVSNVQSVSTNTGAVTIGGGLGVGGDIYARDIYSNGNLIGGGAGTPNGSTSEVQFRYQGTFGADSQFTYNSSTNVLAVDNIQSVAITANSFSSNSGGAPTIVSTSTLTLEASTASRVVVSQSPFKLAIYSVAARDLLTAENGDLIYNSTTGKFQGYAAGSWVDLH
jgi:hypothetical protein